MGGKEWGVGSSGWVLVRVTMDGRTEYWAVGYKGYAGGFREARNQWVDALRSKKAVVVFPGWRGGAGVELQNGLGLV